MSKHCAIVLHAHVPWVWHPEKQQSLEEDWLHGAVLETYLPLLENLVRLREQGVDYRVTLNFSPTLLAMLRQPLLKRRSIAYLDRTLRLCRDEIERDDLDCHGDLARFYEERIFTLRSFFVEKCQGDLVAVIKDLSASGHVELTASALTHGVLPLLMRVPELTRAQVEAGIDEFTECFGEKPRGFWLPECGYAPAIDSVLTEAGIEWTIVDQHAVTHAPRGSSVTPFTPFRGSDSIAFFVRDHNSSSEIWNADDGYPVDPRYRDFMSDLGLEAPIDYLREYLGESKQRQFTGLKFHRSGRENGKLVDYDLDLAKRAVSEHVMHFVTGRDLNLDEISESDIHHPVSVLAFDADLFGHWWYEGADFFGAIMQDFPQRTDIRLTTPSEYLEAFGATISDQDQVPAASSWGEGGYFETWTRPNNTWVLFELQQRAERCNRLTELLSANMDALTDEVASHRKRCLQLMAKELLLACSSDWAFLLSNQPSKEYAEDRVRSHLANFDEAWTASMKDTPEPIMEALEKKNPVFTDLPWDLFASAEKA